MTPEMFIGDASATIHDLGEEFTPFFYLFLTVPQHEFILQTTYGWMYKSFAKCPDKMLDAAPHLQHCMKHLSEIKEHIGEVINILSTTELGPPIHKNYMAAMKLLGQMKGLDHV